MKTIFILTTALISITVFLTSLTIGVPQKQLDIFIPQEYEILDYDSALVNDDLIYDYLIILKRKNEAHNELRPAMFLMSSREDIFEIRFTNDCLIHSSSDGPYPGEDCYSALKLTKDSIIISYTGGMSTRWTEIHKFIYKSDINNFILKDVKLSSYNIRTQSSESRSKNYLDRKITIDKISISKYSIE